MVHLLSLCVYCGSSDAVAPEHLGAAEALGRLAAQQKVDIVFGGGRVGLMGAVADGALAEGGWVVGIIPRHLEVREVGVGADRLHDDSAVVEAYQQYRVTGSHGRRSGGSSQGIVFGGMHSRHSASKQGGARSQ